MQFIVYLQVYPEERWTTKSLVSPTSLLSFAWGLTPTGWTLSGCSDVVRFKAYTTLYLSVTDWFVQVPRLVAHCIRCCCPLGFHNCPLRRFE